MKTASIRALLTTIFTLGLLSGGGRLRAQNISEIAKSDPLIISGAIGTQNTYRYSSVGDGHSSPFSSAIYANLNFSIYGFNMPFSLYFTSDNINFNYPHLSFSLNPTYKNWTGYIGLNSMPMSNYVMNTSFTGIGVEYTIERVRVGAFYGRLRKAINDDPDAPFARNPQYKRMGWGFKAGYGSKRTYIDIYLLRAYDCLSTLDERWQSSLAPQENIVVGTKGAVGLGKYLSLSANAAVSIFNTDKRAPKLHTAEVDNSLWSKVFDVRYSSLARFAGDAALQLHLRKLNASVVYHMVQPDYTSLGVSYISNNYQSLALHLSTHLFDKVALTANFSGQADNLTKKQLYTTQGFVYSATASTRIGKQLNLNASYNGYTQRQTDGTIRVNDTTRVNRMMQSFSLMSSYVIDAEHLGHTMSLSLNNTSNKDKNRFATGESDVKTLAVGANYSMNVKQWATTFTTSFSHQRSKGYNMRYTSDIASLTSGRSFLKERNLNLSGTISLCYNEVERQSKNLSIGGSVGADLTLKDVHVFSASASFYKYGDVNMTKTRSNLDCTDITVSLNYAYTFSLTPFKKKQLNNKE